MQLVEVQSYLLQLSLLFKLCFKCYIIGGPINKIWLTGMKQERCHHASAAGFLYPKMSLLTQQFMSCQASLRRTNRYNEHSRKVLNQSGKVRIKAEKWNEKRSAINKLLKTKVHRPIETSRHFILNSIPIAHDCYTFLKFSTMPFHCTKTSISWRSKSYKLSQFLQIDSILGRPLWCTLYQRIVHGI